MFLIYRIYIDDLMLYLFVIKNMTPTPPLTIIILLVPSGTQYTVEVNLSKIQLSTKANFVIEKVMVFSTRTEKPHLILLSNNVI